MLVRRFQDDRLAQVSYLIGCQQSGEAIVIDPARDLTPYLMAAQAESMRITHVTETHIHADFLSGSRELAAATGAYLLLSGEGGPEWQYQFAASDGATLLHDGDVIRLGNIRLEVFHTPGHTPEHLSFVVTDGARSDEPVAILSGDFIFVGDVGRPDLLETAAGVAGSKESSARALYRSLQRIGALPDFLQVWPGHGAGSACGKALGSMPSSTLGYERRTNWAFTTPDEEGFVSEVLAGQPTTPRYFAQMKRTNRSGPVAIGNRAAPPVLAADALDAALTGGVVIDIRPSKEYARAHLAGTLNIPFIKAFTKWAGWLVPYDHDLFLIVPDQDRAHDAVRALQAIGLDRVVGIFGPEVITNAERVGRSKQMKQLPIGDVPALQRDGVTIIDIRETDEWNAGHLDGAVHHPLGTLPETLAAMDRGTPVALHCEGGTRSAIGAALLEQLGFSNVTDLTGGWRAWRDAKR